MEQKNFMGEPDCSPVTKEAEKIFDSFKNLHTFKKGSTIYRQGETADCFYYIKKGRVRTFFNSADGMEKTLSVAGAGSIIGHAAFFDGKPRVSSATAVTECTAAAIDKTELLSKFSENPHLAMLLLTIQAHSIRMLSKQVSSITFSLADSRIAGILLQAAVHDKNGKTLVYMTHEEIGSMAGVSRVTVSKILNMFARKKIIETGYRCVYIKDPQKLNRLYCREP